VIHKTTAHYDGEGVYAWSCTCGAALSDFTGSLDAEDAGHTHEDEENTMTKESVR
jgi:hypothetical protein